MSQLPAPCPTASWSGAEVLAPPAWQVIDIISDLHLQAGEAATAHAWQQHLAHTTADAMFILGDLFEVWVGDDLAAMPHAPEGAFLTHCQRTLHATSRRLPVFFMHGNRDFLLGPAFAQACGMTLLADPTVLVFDGVRWLLSHGDALCLGDGAYQRFRQQVRQPAWQAAFLAQPLAARQATARQLRQQSETLKASGVTYADVDAAAACTWLHAAQASTLVHGHTHRPDQHTLSDDSTPPLRRWVLSDWDATAQPPRLEVLRLQVGRAPQRVPAASGL